MDFPSNVHPERRRRVGRCLQSHEGVPWGCPCYGMPKSLDQVRALSTVFLPPLESLGCESKSRIIGYQLTPSAILVSALEPEQTRLDRPCRTRSTLSTRSWPRMQSKRIYYSLTDNFASNHPPDQNKKKGTIIRWQRKKKVWMGRGSFNSTVAKELGSSRWSWLLRNGRDELLESCKRIRVVPENKRDFWVDLRKSKR